MGHSHLTLELRLSEGSSPRTWCPRGGRAGLEKNTGAFDASAGPWHVVTSAQGPSAKVSPVAKPDLRVRGKTKQSATAPPTGRD